MGRKVHPIGFRLGINKEWQSRWYADRNYMEMVQEDARIRKMVGQQLTGASLASIEIQRSANQIEVTLNTAKPGVVIGKGGQAVDQLRRDLESMTGKKVKLNIEEIKQPELNAYLVAESIAEQLTRRVSYRRAVKQSVLRAMRAGAKGVRVRVSGRLGGAEMARSVWERPEGVHRIRQVIESVVVVGVPVGGKLLVVADEEPAMARLQWQRQVKPIRLIEPTKRGVQKMLTDVRHNALGRGQHRRQKIQQDVIRSEQGAR